MSFIDNLKHLVVEDEPETAPVAKPVQQVYVESPHGGYTIYQPPPPTAVAIASVPTPDNGFYNSLFDKTNFDNTPSGKVLNAKLEMLKDTGLDERTKLVTALKFGLSENLTVQSILSTFDTLKATLQAEKDNFDKAAVAAQSHEVEGRKAEIQKISDQMAELQKKQVQLSTELAEQQSKIQNGQTKFTSAFNSRTIELDNQRNHYQALLG